MIREWKETEEAGDGERKMMTNTGRGTNEGRSRSFTNPIESMRAMS